MTVTYLFRSPGTGHSIGELFGSIQHHVDRQSGIRASRIQLPYISRGLRSVWKNLQFLKTLTADVFHITGDIHYAALALPASRTVLTIHDCITLQANRKRPFRYALFWLLWYYLPIRRAAIVTAVSEKTRQELIHFVGQVAQKVVVVPNGYDPDFVYHPAQFQKDRPLLLQLGTAPHKNLSRLITAIEGIACSLIIIGPLTDELILTLQQHKIAYQNYVNLSHAEVVQWYATCDIVTFMSTYEGFGMPILEANATGRVIITSDIAPMRDVASEAAHLIDPTNISAIRQGILQLIDDDIYRHRLITAGLENARQYSLTKATAGYVRLYQQIASSTPSPELVS